MFVFAEQSPAFDLLSQISAYPFVSLLLLSFLLIALSFAGRSFFAPPPQPPALPPSKDDLPQRPKAEDKPKAPEAPKPEEKSKAPEAPTPEDKPKAQDKPKAEDKPKAPEAPTPEDKPKAQDKPKTQDKPKAEDKPKAQDKSKKNEKQPEKPGKVQPKAEEKPKAPEVPKPEEKPKAPEVPKAEDKPKAPETPKTEDKTKTEEKPKAPEAPKPEEKPKTPEAPKTEDKAKTEEKPKAPEAPKTEDKPKAEEKKDDSLLIRVEEETGDADEAAKLRRERSAARKARRELNVEEVELKQEKSPDVRTLREGLEKTRSGWISKLNSLLLGKKQVGKEIVEELEEVLYTADLGTKTTQDLLKKIEDRLERKELKDSTVVKEALKDEMYKILALESKSLEERVEKPLVVMVVGVNGVGKTTTIGKIAARLSKSGRKVMLAAGDTFRAAADEQLELWASRVNADFVQGKKGQDPSSVVHEAVKKAASQGSVDVVLADTAGRLENKMNLMEELKKVKRVIGQAHASAPHEVLLVLDATTGQNAVNQARKFHEAVGVTGIVITKLDGTAKGGVVVAICDELKIPIRYIGVGEHLDELRRFSAAEFVDALFQ